MNAEVKGILIQHDGTDYALTSDGTYPDLLRRDGDSWVSIKKKGRAGEAGPVASTMLGYADPQHTQTVLRELGVRSVQELIERLFGGAWGG